MSLISRINGSLLSTLSGGSRNTSSENKSEISGTSTSSSASFQAAVVDIRPGLSKAANAFVSSLDSLNPAYVRLSDSKDLLSEIKDSVTRLKDIAEEATDTTISQEERDSLSLGFQAEILRLRALVEDPDDGSASLLSMDDLEDVLDSANIDRDGSSTLAQTFKKLGGRDGELGSENIILDNETSINPLSTRVRSLEEATIALEAFTALEKQVDRDLEGIDIVASELQGAALFARAGAVAFDNAVGYAQNNKDPEKVAQLIVQSIRSQTSDSALGEHSSLDQALAAALLVDNV